MDEQLTVDRIECVDCMDAMKSMPDGSVDLIVTSPPYNNWRNKRTQAGKSEYWKRTNIVYDSYSDKMTDEEYADWQVKFINECMRVLKDTGTMCYNHKDMIFNFTVISPLSWIFKSNAVFRQRVTWDRCGMQAFNNVRFYRTEEDIYILGKNAKGFKWNKDAAKYKSIWKIPPSKKNDGHPCSFPDEIPRRCIEAFTDENDIVLDPFCGVGTTCLVARQMNRRYIGFDISDRYCDIARERLDNAKS